MNILNLIRHHNLSIGQLIISTNSNLVYQILPKNKMALVFDMDNIITAQIEVPLKNYKENSYELTTAYDAGIDPKTLPIPEPFWTGWVVCDGYKFEPVDYGDNGSKLFEDGWHRDFLKSDCQPCLSPK